MNNNLKNILAIDTSSKLLRLGLQFGSDRLIKSNSRILKSHGQIIIRQIQNQIESSGLSLKDLDAIAVCTGPGSFTGLRISISVAKGIAVALDIPIIEINLFEIANYLLRNESVEYRLLVPFIKDQFFVADLSSNVEENADSITVSELKTKYASTKLAAIGFDLSDKLFDENSGISVEPLSFDCTEILYLASEKINKSEFSDIDTLEPMYIKKSQAEINFEKRNISKN